MRRSFDAVSDVQSTCGDPCPVAREIRDQLGIDFQTVIIGFQVGSSAEAELQCIADETDGTYISVDDGQGLMDAIKDAVTTPPTDQTS